MPLRQTLTNVSLFVALTFRGEHAASTLCRRRPAVCWRTTRLSAPNATCSQLRGNQHYPETSLLHACNSSESMQLKSATHQPIIRLTARQTFLGRPDYQPQRRRRLVKVQNTGNALTHRPAQGLVLGRQVDPIHRVAVSPLRPTKAWISTVESVIGHRPLVTGEDRAVCSCWTVSMRVGT